MPSTRSKRVAQPTERGFEYAKALLERTQQRAQGAFHKSSVKEWVKQQSLVSEHDGIVHDDVSSSSKSSRSRVSSIASARAKEEQRVLEHTARSAALKEREVIEEAKLKLAMEKAKIKMREEELELSTQIAIASGRKLILDRLEDGGSYEPLRMGEKPTHSVVQPEHLPIRHAPVNARAQELDPNLLMSQHQVTRTTSEEGKESKRLNPAADEFAPSQETKQKPIPVPLWVPDSNLYSPGSLVHAENDVISTMIKELKKPQSDIKTFCGDPLEYRRFIRQFESRIVTNTTSDEGRINYLEQYTGGEAHRIVLGYSCLEASTGYPAALEELKERYGDNNNIAQAYIRKALDWPSIEADNTKALDDYSIFLKECENAVRSIESIKVLEYPDNSIKLVKKLPYHMHHKWRNIAYEARERKSAVKFSDLTDYVRREAKKYNDPVYGREALQKKGTSKTGGQNTKMPPQKNPIRPKGSFATVKDRKEKEVKTVAATIPEKKPCLHCNGHTHSIDQCEIFQKLKMDERMDVLRAKRACFGCLKPNHRSKDCRHRLTCGVCQKRHPTVLHLEKEPEKFTSNAGTIACSDGDAEVTMAIVPVRVKLKNQNRSIETYAFLDPGSTVNFCTESLMSRLGAGGKRAKITLDTMGSEHTYNTFILKNFEICDLHGHNTIHLLRAFTKDKIPVSSRHIPRTEDIRKWPHLDEVNLPEINGGIGLLIGNGVPDAYTPIKSVTGPQGSPHAVKTRLGWIAWNVVRDGEEADQPMCPVPVNTAVTAIEKIDHMQELDILVRSSFNHDFPEQGIEEEALSQEDKRFMKLAEDSINFQNGHYEMRLPFREENTKLPNNKTQALQRLNSLKQKMRKNQKFYEDYSAFMDVLLQKGYASQIPEKDHHEEGKVWYIPHHGVYHPQKPNKIRVVFDCAAKFCGISLNSTLLQGPDLTNKLVGVLLRFRQEEIALMGDIEKMFHQVRVAEEDRNYLRFLWWPKGDIDAEAVEYRMNVHLFGATSSPSCANYALRRVAQDNDQYPTSVTSTLLRNLYVDDCLKSVKDGKEAVALVKDLQDLAKKGGFRLTTWSSNCRQVLETIAEEDLAKGIKDLDLAHESLPTERAPIRPIRSASEDPSPEFVPQKSSMGSRN
ncbi:uncharacterized protein LOC135486033 [Lineus longissimus]|uniref:uncharacterized protein LOC135486033 n=1 Tax=Lineus longissimus TaxID=88925 RepID=UPI00315DB1C7